MRMEKPATHWIPLLLNRPKTRSRREIGRASPGFRGGRQRGFNDGQCSSIRGRSDIDGRGHACADDVVSALVVVLLVEDHDDDDDGGG